MALMFALTSDFNADIGNWDVSNVEVMSGMFFNAGTFNRDLARWDTAKVRDRRPPGLAAHREIQAHHR